MKSQGELLVMIKFKMYVPIDMNGNQIMDPKHYVMFIFTTNSMNPNKLIHSEHQPWGIRIPFYGKI